LRRESLVSQRGLLPFVRRQEAKRRRICFAQKGCTQYRCAAARMGEPLNPANLVRADKQ